MMSFHMGSLNDCITVADFRSRQSHTHTVGRIDGGFKREKAGEEWRLHLTFDKKML